MPESRKEKKELPTNIIPLFDIDWTLLEGGNKAHYDSFDYMFDTVYGIKASIREIVPHGMIDNQVIVEILKLHSVPEEEIKPKIIEATRAMERYFLEHQEEGRYIPMPGTLELLSALREKSIPLGLLTGNVESIAWRKLERAGLKDFFAFGSFGNMAFKRVDLIDIARQKAKEKLGINEGEFELVIVGDSPLDIKTAKAGGIKSIAVGAGPYKVEELSKTGAELVVESLQNRQTVLDFLKAS